MGKFASQECENIVVEESELVPCGEEIAIHKSKQMEFVSKRCDMVPVEIDHKKTRPVCRNETKLNCATIWNTDANGVKVWSGKEDCTPVTWLKCEDEEYDASYTTMESLCVDDEVIPYTISVPNTFIQPQCLRQTFSLQQKCRTLEPATQCVSHSYHECGPNMEPVCEPTDLVEPQQEWVHQEKCLFETNGDEVDAEEAKHAMTIML